MTLNDDLKLLKVYVGWDSREDISYRVAKQSIEDRCSVNVKVVPLKQHSLRESGLYWRDEDVLASTEFTFTRFLIPHLMQHNGWALFIDCDFVFLDDVKKLFDQRDDKYAVMCAQHDYTPPEGTKMDGKQQLQYPRKNWSSMVLWNCSHPSNKQLDKFMVNNPSIDGKFLHRFSWLKDHEIGKISHEWNWLVGWYKEPKDGYPKALHYTEGGPWFEEYQDCEYANEYYKVERKYLQGAKKASAAPVIEIDNLTLGDDHKEVLKTVLKHRIDPKGQFYGVDKHEAIKAVTGMGNIVRVAAIEGAGDFESTGVFLDKKGLVYDEYLEAFTKGCPGYLSTYDAEKHTSTPLVIRGLTKNAREITKDCWAKGRDFYFIDSGYIGNERSKSKIWHRITKNSLQNTGPIIDRPKDRLKLVGTRCRKMYDGSKILICPPSEKVMAMYDQPSPEDWTNNVVEELKKLTDRPIEIRLKPKREDRISTQSIENALADDVYCLITYNSIAALEALINGKPAIALGQNCATLLCNTSLKDIENLNRPTPDEVTALMAHLSYCQFTRQEMMNGYAWNILNESS